MVAQLLETGAKVHAVVRDPSSAQATALKEKGVVLFQGTFEEPQIVFREAARGVTGLFLNLSVMEPGTAKAQAEAVIEATKAGASSTLTSIVLSSTYRTAEWAGDNTAPAATHPWLGAYYAAKAEVEAAVRGSGIQHYTILRPPVLNYDFLLPASATSHAFPALPRAATFVTSLDEGNTMPYLDEADVAKFAVAVFKDPPSFSGHEIELAADNLTAEQVRATLARVSGVPVKLHRRTEAEKEASKNTDFFQIFEKLANSHPRVVDIEALDKYRINLTTLEEYLEKHKEQLLGSLPPRALKAL